MMHLASRQFSPPLLCAIASLAIGLFSGFAAVHNLSPKSYGPEINSLAPYMGGTKSEFAAQDDYQPASYDECDGCSDRDRGYHWAALQRIASVGECPSESWDFRRGCASYMRDTGGL
jgi:hypothetical protein